MVKKNDRRALEGVHSEGYEVGEYGKMIRGVDSKVWGGVRKLKGGKKKKGPWHLPKNPLCIP